MGLFDSFKCRISSLNLERQTFFPGNLVNGTVGVEVDAGKEISFRAVRVIVIAELFQKWSSSRSDGNGGTRHDHHTRKTNLARLSIVVAGNASDAQPSCTLQGGRYAWPFAFVLPSNYLPSFHVRSGDKVNALRYHVDAVVDIPYGFDKSREVPFMVLLPMSLPMWNAPSAVTRQNHFDVTCCCCISKGSCEANISLSKTTLAIDRDVMNVSVSVDNSKGEEPVNAIKVQLKCIATATVGHHQTVEETIYEQAFPANIAAGASGSASGTVRLGGFAPASFSSPALTVQYMAVVELVLPGMTSDPRLSMPIYVAHSVDQANVMMMQTPAMQQQQQPIMQFAQWAPLPDNAMTNVPNFAPTGAAAAALDPNAAPFASVDKTAAEMPNAPASSYFPPQFFAGQQVPAHTDDGMVPNNMNQYQSPAGSPVGGGGAPAAQYQSVEPSV